MKIHKPQIPCTLPVVIIDTDNELVTKEIFEYCGSFKDTMEKRTNVQADMTNFDIWRDTPVFDKMLTKILKLVNEHRYSLEMQEWVVTNAWVARYGKDEITKPHEHVPAQLSFIYYLNCTGNPSPLIFEGEQDYKVEAETGRLIIFPACMRHRVDANGDGDRWVLAGNVHMKQMRIDEKGWGR